MSTFILDKQVKLSDVVDSVKSVLVDDALNYTRLKDGIRVEGTISVNGEYASKEKIQPFADSLDVDMFVPNEKIADVKNFRLRISNCDYHILEEAIMFHIKCDVQGEESMKEQFSLEDQIKGVMKDLENDPNPFINKMRANLSKEDSIMLEKCLNGEFTDLEIITTGEEEHPYIDKSETIPVEEIKRAHETADIEMVCSDVEEMPCADKKTETVSVNPRNKELAPKTDNSVKSDLFRNENYVIFATFYKVQTGETYADVARKHNVDVNELIILNKNKPLNDGTLIQIRR